jgi:YggT family protein
MDIIGTALLYLTKFIELAIFIRIILSWMRLNKDSKIIIIIYQITEPVIAPVRKAIQKTRLGQNMMFDFSLIATYLLLMIIQIALIAVFNLPNSPGIF